MAWFLGCPLMGKEVYTSIILSWFEGNPNPTWLFNVPSCLHLGHPQEGEEKDGKGRGDAGVADVEEDVGQGRVQAARQVVRVPK